MNDIVRKIENLFNQYVDIRKKAESEKRAMNKSELTQRDAFKTEIDALVLQVDQATAEDRLRETLYGSDTRSNALTLIDDSNGTTLPVGDSVKKQPGRDYRSLFSPDGRQALDRGNFKSAGEFFEVVRSGRFDPRLRDVRGLTIGTPSDGGYLVPVEYSAQIHDVALESEIVLPRCNVEPMLSDEKKVPAAEIGSHSASLFGGMIAYWKGETASLEESTPKFRQMTLKAKKLTALWKYSNEWIGDAPNGEAKLIELVGGGLGWYRDRAFLKGSGAGEPLGILNAGCTITVDKESEQAADTICYENLTAMLGRLYPGSFKNSLWVCHISTIPQLLRLQIAVGTGGSAYPALSESNGEWRLLTRPVIFTEKTETLGAVGDVILADFSQYTVGLRSDMRFDISHDYAFTTDESYGRLIARMDGQPLWNEALTLEDGTTTVSPFVVLEAR